MSPALGKAGTHHKPEPGQETMTQDTHHTAVAWPCMGLCLQTIRNLGGLLAIGVVLSACGGQPEAADGATEVDPTSSETTTSAHDPDDQGEQETTPEKEAEVAAADRDDSPSGLAETPDRTPMEIVTSNCASCHTGRGPGTSHLRLETIGDLLDNTDITVPALESGFMPPWPASNHGVAFRDSFDIRPSERDALIQWLGSPEATAQADKPVVTSVPVRRLSDPDLVVTPIGGYDGTAYQPDEYRCFIYDPELTTARWLTAYEFVPDQTEIVHHAIGYLASADMRDRANELDAQHPDQGGWPCFGGAGIGGNEIFLGWAPGQGPTYLPEGSGMPLEPGDFLVVQVHYHFEVDAPTDQSTLQLQFAPPGDDNLDTVRVRQFAAPAEIPCGEDEEGPLCDRATAKEAAIQKYGTRGVLADQLLFLCGQSLTELATLTDGVASSSCDLPVRARGTIVSVLGHQHEIGKSVRLTLNPDTTDEQILLDIPDWRFEWQLSYYLEDEIAVKTDDVLRLECSWDRARRDPTLEPAYVLWADGTDDEMCFATMAVREAD